MDSQDIEVAAILVLDAQAGRNLRFKRDGKSVRAYKLYQHITFKLGLLACVWGIMLLALIEKPGLCGYELPYWATMLIEFAFLSYFLGRFFHNFYFTANLGFWKDPKNIAVISTIFLSCIDMICYAIWMEAGPTRFHPVRWTRCLRPLFLINFPEGRQVRKAFRSIRRTLIDIGHGLFLLLASIALFSLMALKIFEMRDIKHIDGRPYFKNYFEIFWELYVLVTTSNSPDVMMPAYSTDRWYAIFFGCFIVVNLYIFMSIVLAIVFYNYKKHLKNEVKVTVYRKRKTLGEAFDIVCEPSEIRKAVSKERFQSLLKVAIPRKSSSYLEVIYNVLDQEGSGYVSKTEFLKLADLLNVPLSEGKDEISQLERRFPVCYGSAPSMFIRKIVRHRFFHLTFDLAICVNALCIAMNWDQAEWFFLTIFVIEILLNLYSNGPVQYFRNTWNVFDFVIVFSAVVVTICEAITGNSETTEVLSLDSILVIRVLRLVRLLMNSKRFMVILTTIVNIGPSIVTYGCVLFVIYYVFAIVGMELFGGLVVSNGTEWCGNPALNNSEFFALQYCSNNFNDLARAFVTLCELTVVNQWHVIANGFVLMTNKAARLYFFAFHVVGVVILLNIITAFVLEAFMLEYTVSRQNHLRDAVLKTIEKLGLTKECQTTIEAHVNQDGSVTDYGKNEGGLGAETGEKTYFTLIDHGFKKMEVVLQEMFEKQIESTDQGPLKEEEDDSDYDEAHMTSFNYMAM